MGHDAICESCGFPYDCMDPDCCEDALHDGLCPDCLIERAIMNDPDLN